MFQKILTALDKSEISKHVFEEALALAKANGASLLLLHVLSVDEEDYPLVAGRNSWNYDPKAICAAIESFQKHWQKYEQQGLELLRSHTAQATAAGVKAEFTQNLGGPGACICAVARAWGADLIVVGRRRLSVWRELVPGSVSSYVLHHAPCTVMAVQYPVKKNIRTLHSQPLKLASE